jgi:hypothetical protein
MADDTPRLDSALAARAAAYFSQRREFLGYWLEAYRAAAGLEPAALARWLGCSVDTLSHLALCLRPREERLESDVAGLAARYGVHPDRLADALLPALAQESPRAAYPAAAREPAGVREPPPEFTAADERAEDLHRRDAESAEGDSSGPDRPD